MESMQIDPSIIAFCQARSRLEYETVSAICANPELSLTFEAAGGTPALFEEIDARAIYACLRHWAGVTSKRPCAILAKRLLCHMSLFDNSTLSLRYGAPWCDESLAKLFDSYPESKTATIALTKKLIELSGRQRNAVEYLKQAGTLLEIDLQNDYLAREQ